MTPDVFITHASYAELEPFSRELRRAGMVKLSLQGLFFAARLPDGSLVAFAGIGHPKREVCCPELKHDFTLPDYRRRGLWSRLFAHRVRHLRSLGIRCATAVCTPMSLPLYLARGARISRQYKTVTEVYLDLASVCRAMGGCP